MNGLRLLSVVVAAILATCVLSAHHSQAGAYVINKDQKIEGQIAQLLIRSPHSFVHVDVKGEKGEVVRWVLEWGSAAHLGRTGVDTKTLKVGDTIVAGGHPGRNPADHRMIVASIERPADGWSWGRRPGEVVD